MYQYSSNIKLYNHYGYSSDDQTVECGLENKYIQYQFDHSNTIQSLVEAEFESNSNLPCSNVTIFCDQFNVSTLNESCSMEYIFHENNLEKFYLDTMYENDTCANIALIDIVNMRCNGNCNESPTISPTPAPTNEPTAAPSTAPTVMTDDPSLATSSAPTVPPSIAPSVSPTFMPSSVTDTPSLLPTSTTNTPTLYLSHYQLFLHLCHQLIVQHKHQRDLQHRNKTLMN